MAIRKILKMGNPLLRNLSEDVTEDEVQTKEFKKLLRDMFETMKHADGVGLAAPQIGVLKKILVIGSEEDPTRYKGAPLVPSQIIINPIIEPLTQEVDGYWEGCLSVPGMRGFVERANKIRLTWKDEKFNTLSEEISGFRAIVLQHECDHLNGILYVDRLKSSKLFGFNEEVDSAGKDLD
jgi:peptide deformylase